VAGIQVPPDRCAQTVQAKNDTEEATVTTEIISDVQQTYHSQAVESERGLMVAMLVMVVLGVAGIFAVSA
jgi:hypothetical protein